MVYANIDKEKIIDLRDRVNGKATDKTYLIEERKPLALIHLMKNTNANLEGFPEYIYAIGLGFPGGKTEKKANYVIEVIS